MIDNTEISPEARPLDFIRQIIAEDLRSGKHQQTVTRFPPEPNGFLHIGHAKSICLNFGIGLENNSPCHLRFDDTNPSKEESAYVESIKRDVKWLGFDWGQNLFYASDYFDRLYEYAIQLIKLGKAYVCELSAEEIRTYRGTLTEPGKESPYRNLTIEENLDLFQRMKDGEFDEGSRVLRAKIDMASPNLNMRDPVIYRILKVSHHRTGDTWCIYPMYDYTHCISDAIEGITHSLCTLEFEDHRPLYDWFLDTLKTKCHPRQIEFARLNLTYTVMSKRKILQLVQGDYVQGWDDPRMLTISGLRRRGYSASAIRKFCSDIGIGKKESWIDMSVLENAVRDDLNETAPRVLAVLNPLKVIIDNYPQGQSEDMEAQNHPQRPEMGSRTIPFSREIYIEREDFMEDPPKKFFRLGPDREVRLRYGYFIRCVSVIKDTATGEITEIHCTYDPETRGGSSPDGRKVKGTIHWVSAAHAIQCPVRLYDRLFLTENPDADKQVDFKEHLNSNSLTILDNCMLEPSLAKAQAGESFQFERHGYFCADLISSQPGAPVFNRTVTLRDSWIKTDKS
ncbi:MAG: glutamine--tRNA ligase/YqeY domain fusion protein [Proteobacteria bacterium]|jgi:glutaminyl-tRNA synthetase|nr:glutamine--tRNA ligase/YqeY domain fusion protein [Desulfocapsa sp.]MBU3944988.1 glutamine--tRNA ligase/YqeY domain fusion protein [Pseudomonadota bacterium]MCG2745536.1 glutamine--tRNA ligase/YqeY domain fusion protein [Desulfobacteraceae bacterium]MBU4029084.1 glutamine--tRNA ligase/YqeY domain fusion protein [Pseudomonadota bacterium]MBU4042842.1 glutamine--tRNA ligase/YqeY domain fusion protein [Pseudomonadota bacterium]